jgi:hypothetical protein
MADNRPLSENEADDRLKAALNALGEAPRVTVAADTALNAARRALSLISLGLIPTGVKRELSSADNTHDPLLLASAETVGNERFAAIHRRLISVKIGLPASTVPSMRCKSFLLPLRNFQSRGPTVAVIGRRATCVAAVRFQQKPWAKCVRGHDITRLFSRH